MGSARDLLAVATNPDPDRERKMADEAEALRLLAGFSADRGRPIIQYLKRNSPAERKGRTALARCVRDSMRGLAGELLALAIDPYTPSKIPGMKPTRRIRFESPARGKSSTWARDLSVVGFIRTQRAHWTDGKFKQDAVVQAAMSKFGLSRATVQAIWRRHTDLLRLMAKIK